MAGDQVGWLSCGASPGLWGWGVHAGTGRLGVIASTPTRCEASPSVVQGMGMVRRGFRRTRRYARPDPLSTCGWMCPSYSVTRSFERPVHWEAYLTDSQASHGPIVEAPRVPALGETCGSGYPERSPAGGADDGRGGGVLEILADVRVGDRLRGGVAEAAWSRWAEQPNSRWTSCETSAQRVVYGTCLH